MFWTAEGRAAFASLCAAAAMAACGNASVADCAAERDGVTSVGRLPDAAQHATFVELWRVGGLNEDQHFALPLPLAVSRDGRVAVADFQLGEASVVEPDGSWRGRIARRGMGPGELSSPVALVWDDHGGLHVYDIVKHVIVRFDESLQVVEELRVDPAVGGPLVRAGSLEWAGLQPSGHILLRPGLEARPNDREGREVLLRMSAQSATADTLAARVTPVLTIGGIDPVRAPGFARLTSAVGAGGRVAFAGASESWEVTVVDDEGGMDIRLCAGLSPQPLTGAEQGRGLDPEQRDHALAFGSAPRPAEPAAVGRVVVGADGTIWVQRERPDPVPDMSSFFGRRGGVFDVLAPDGRHLRTVAMPANARLQGALGDTIWALEVGDLGEISLAAYRVEQ
jgi:hypothetical protein